MARLSNTALSVIAPDVEGCFHLYTIRYQVWPERIGSKGVAHRLSAESVSSARYLTSRQTRCTNEPHNAGRRTALQSDEGDNPMPMCILTMPGYTAAEQQATTVPLTAT